MVVGKTTYAVVFASLLCLVAIVVLVLYNFQDVLNFPHLPGKFEYVMSSADPNATMVVLERQERRKAVLTDICEKYVPDKRLMGGSNLYPKMYSSDKQRFLYCGVTKVACTSWNRLLGRANGMPSRVHPHSRQFYKYVKEFKTLSSFARRRALSSYFKFMFVRHPFERLVSGYRDKLVEPPNAPYFKPVADKIKRKYRTDKHLRDGPPTFREFVLFIIDPKTKRPFDPHWRPMHELCQPCLVHFDFIGHYETLAVDSRYVLDRLRIEEDQLPQPKIFRNSSSIVADMFSQLNEDEVRRLFNVYRLDFALFGYSPNMSQFVHTTIHAAAT